MIKADRIYVKEEEKEYFGLKVRAFISEGSEIYYSSFPWSFEIEFNGKLIQFAGIPNKVETKKKALKRAWWRAKWLSEGNFEKYYS